MATSAEAAERLGKTEEEVVGLGYLSHLGRARAPSAMRASTCMRVIIAFVVIFALLVWYFAFAEHQAGSEAVKLPVGAANVIDHGNGWTEFTLEGTVYLYHRSSQGYSGFEAITAIPGKINSSGEQSEKDGW